MALPTGPGFGYAPLGESGPFGSLWEFLHEGEAATAGVTEPRLEPLLRRTKRLSGRRRRCAFWTT